MAINPYESPPSFPLENSSVESATRLQDIVFLLGTVFVATLSPIGFLLAEYFDNFGWYVFGPHVGVSWILIYIPCTAAGVVLSVFAHLRSKQTWRKVAGGLAGLVNASTLLLILVLALMTLF